MNDDDFFSYLMEIGYLTPRTLPNGEVGAVTQMLFTGALVGGLDRIGYKTRFCYPTISEALTALAEWSGDGDPPGNWIKQKGPVERSNPNLDWDQAISAP